MKKLYFLLLAASVVAGSANAQLRVDSLGRSEFGTRPDEVMDELRIAQTTIYGEADTPVLNLYADHSTTHYFNPGNYFLQCVYGNTNGENGDRPIVSSKKLFERVFYVTHSGIVYAKSNVISPAVDPGISIIGPMQSKATSATRSPLSRLDGITGVSYSEETVNGASAKAMTTSDSPSQARQRLGLLAEEVEAGVPEAVVTLDDGTKGISYSDLVVVLIDAVNELNGKVQAL